MIAVIAGATGLIGQLLLMKLIHDQSIDHVIAVSRRPIPFKHTKLEVLQIPNLIQLEQFRDKLKGDLYFCCLGTTIKDAGSQEEFRKIDQHAVISFGQIARFHQAQAFVTLSAAGASEHSLAFYNRVKGQTEVQLARLQLQRLVIFRPGLLIGERAKKRPLEEMAIRFYLALAPLLGKNIKKKIATDSEYLAGQMLVEAKKRTAGTFIIEAINI